ncbi:hypothetical protein LQW54_008157 [Pestalotiopsis sp. IQ-011]
MFEGAISMDSHKEVSHRDVAAPETIPPYQEGIETAAQPYYQQSTHHYAYERSQVSPASTTIKSYERKLKQMIFGLRRRNFVVLIVIIAAIIAASIGGAVGSMSSKKDDSGCATATTKVTATASTSSARLSRLLRLEFLERQVAVDFRSDSSAIMWKTADNERLNV